ncbi:MAG: chromate resistance protein ChrB domain-containing protein [Pseudomonadota bacterium]
MKYWLSLIISLPTENANARMRAWRTLKASGSAVLRDGVYLMPDRDACRQVLDGVAADVVATGGTAYVIRMEEPAGADFTSLFDRGAEFAALNLEVGKAHESATLENANEVLKQARKLRKAFMGLVEIDFFDSEAQKQTHAALQELERTLARILSPDEPHPTAALIALLQLKDYAGRTWATRKRPWVDRLACAWLIRRHIDPQAKLLWLVSPQDCPKDALGFDFDGATFSHVGAKVSFEVMLASFALETPALRRMGQLVHFLDVGGLQPPEASGIESVLAGMRDAILDDDQLLLAASAIFDGLLKTFSKETASP